MRVFALSDLHVDFGQNMSWLHALSPADYTEDAIILAGDVSDNPARLEDALLCVRGKFAYVFFVPGNHDLWVRRNGHADSVEKFRHILDVCRAIGVHTAPARIKGDSGGTGVWIVPLFSWYTKPEEGASSLFLPKPGEDPSLGMWCDNTFVSWPGLDGSATASGFFLQMNEGHIQTRNGTPVISFSHFLPRRELMFSAPDERRRRGGGTKDPNPAFNFSRVAGCTGLDAQIRQLRSAVHVYGHQHRNRDRVIDGVRYVSHCLGYPRERARGHIHGIEEGPMLIWCE